MNKTWIEQAQEDQIRIAYETKLSDIKHGYADKLAAIARDMIKAMTEDLLALERQDPNFEDGWYLQDSLKEEATTALIDYTAYKIGYRKD